ncbi:rhomboid family intramembrane serine protease [uncultured Paracoccus sp.]|uniref:rhomboid family intramembrane serine protease n=1 Tax=uncultured Paracoccus sp. TaxID=189685 RepID=UPI0026375122|nr:rhomboid family intramembrane serine protease [uncultured Paracoccus sp.]
MPAPFRIILIQCVAIEAVLSLAALAGYPGLRDTAFLFGGFFPLLLDGWQGVYPGQSVGMFVTYGFLHGGPLHLGMNMIALVQLTREMRGLMTVGRMLLIYAVAQVAAGLAQTALSPGEGVMVGASGAIFGLAAALIAHGLVVLRRRRRPAGPLIRSALLIAGLNVALPVLIPQIAWQAHLGGTVAGAVLGLGLALLSPGRPRYR